MNAWIMRKAWCLWTGSVKLWLELSCLHVALRLFQINYKIHKVLKEWFSLGELDWIGQRTWNLWFFTSSAGRKDAGGRYFKRAKYESALERLILKNWELDFSRNADIMRHAQIGHLRTKHFWPYLSWSGSPPFWLCRGCVAVKLRRYSLASEMLQHRDDIKVPLFASYFSHGTSPLRRTSDRTVAEPSKDNTLWTQAQEVKAACELNAVPGLRAKY